MTGQDVLINFLHDGTRRDKTRFGGTGQDGTRQEKTGLSYNFSTRHDENRQDGTGQDMAGQDMTRPSKTTQDVLITFYSTRRD